MFGWSRGRGPARGDAARGRFAMKFLIVDDDPAIVEALTIGLSFQWPTTEIFCAGDGEQGLRLFLQQAPDLTLLDIHLPGLSGWAVLAQIRAASDAPVIIL